MLACKKARGRETDAGGGTGNYDDLISYFHRGIAGQAPKKRLKLFEFQPLCTNTAREAPRRRSSSYQSSSSPSSRALASRGRLVDLGEPLAIGLELLLQVRLHVSKGLDLLTDDGALTLSNL